MAGDRRICKVQGCDRIYHCRGYCIMHYARLKDAGEFNHHACTVDECDRVAVVRGYCHKHYRRVLRHGDPSVVLSRKGITLRRKKFNFLMGTMNKDYRLNGHDLTELGIDVNELEF